MSRFYPIASGSSGNCTYIGHGKQGILVDVGISAKAVNDALALAAIDVSSILGIFITHEHTDHISGLRVFAKKHRVPIFTSKETAAALLSGNDELSDLLHTFDEQITVGNIVVTRFCTSHDCSGSSGYTFAMPDGKKCAVCTDLGVISPQVHNALLGCSAILIESNHDVTMLQKGSYPEPLKKRILSDHGHLSNVSCAAELKRLAESGTTRFILGHLSRENNRPEIAKSMAVAALMDCGLKEDEDYTLYIAPQKNGKMIIF